MGALLKPSEERIRGLNIEPESAEAVARLVSPAFVML
jgi:hypothetical protein